MPAFITNAVQVQRFADALYNVNVGTATMAQVTADITASGGLDNALNAYYSSSFTGVPTATVAANMCTYLGIVAGSNGLVAADVTNAQNYIVGTLNAAPANARGAAVKGILNNLASLTSDKVYGAVATKFNSDIDKALAYTGAADITAGTAPSPITNLTFTLTTGVDAGASFTGGKSDDIFVGSIIDTLGTGTTLNPGDSLTGGDGTDTLIATITGNPTASTFVLQTSSVEQINIGNYDSDVSTDATIDLSATSGVTTLTMTGGNGDTLFTGLKSTVTVGGSNSTGDISVTYASTVLVGTADVQNITLNAFGLTGDRPTLTVADAGSASNIAETLAFNVTGSNFITLNGSNNTKTINVSGAGSLAINTAGENTITKIDASTATGAVQILDIGASNLTMTGGAGNDVLRIDGSTINLSDSIDAGAGTDVLQLTAATNIGAAPEGARLIGFEQVLGQRTETFAEDGATSTVVAQNISLLGASNVTTVGTNSFTLGQTVGVGGGDDETIAYGVNFTGLAAGVNMALSGMSVTDASTAAADDGLVINFTATARLATDTTADSITATLGSTTAAATSTATLSGGVQDSSTAFNVILDLDNYETVSLVSQGGSNTLSSLTDANLKTLNVNAIEALTISAGTWGLLTTIDASASAKNVSIAATTRASTLTGGAGNDTLTGSSSADTIAGGAGNDSLTGGGGNDTISGGDGNDTIVATGTAQDVITGGAGDDTITGATGNDNINGGDGNDVFIINASDNATPVLDLSSADTIVGGDGTDTIRIDGAQAGARTLDISASTETRFANVSGIEKITLNSTTSAITLKVGDIAMGAFASGLTVDITSGNTLGFGVDASPVLNSSSKITFTGNSGANTYTLGNNIDSANLSTGDDTFAFTNLLFLQATDTLNGGVGSDSLSMDINASTTVTAAQMAGLTSVETFTIVSDNATTDAFVIGLSDAVVSANKDVSTDTYTIAVTDDANNGTLSVNASSSTSTITTGKLKITGGRGADTVTGGSLADLLFGAAGADSLTGGAGNDTIDGGAGVDSINGGDGVDTIQQSVVTSNGRDVISGFVAGSTGDVFYLGSAIGGANATLLSGTNNFASSAAIETLGASGTAAAATEIVRYTAFTMTANLATTTTANDLDGTNLLTAVTALTLAADQNKALVLIGDQFGNTGIYYVAESNDAAAAVAAADCALIGVLVGVSVSSLTFGNFANGALAT